MQYPQKTVELSVILTLIFAVGCSSKTSGPEPVFNNTNSDYRAKRIQAISSMSEIVDANVAAFSAEIDDLETAVDAWHNAPSDQSLADARAQFTASILAWQRVESLEVGPIAGKSAPGGSDLRDEIYSWPTANPCRVDQELVAQGFSNMATFDALLVNARGFDALETVLWHTGENACPPQADINAEGTWNTITDLESRRTRYAVAIVDNLVIQRDALNTSFETFRDALASPPNDLFANEQEALNALFGGLLYLDTDVKDLKVGRPLGLIDCPDARCLSELELAVSSNDLPSIHANLVALKTFGFSENGFAELLAEVGGQSISDAITGDLDAAITIAETDTTFGSMIADDSERADQLYGHIKNVTDRLKTDFAATLGLDLPQTADGDND